MSGHTTALQPCHAFFLRPAASCSPCPSLSMHAPANPASALSSVALPAQPPSVQWDGIPCCACWPVPAAACLLPLASAPAGTPSPQPALHLQRHSLSTHSTLYPTLPSRPSPPLPPPSPTVNIPKPKRPAPPPQLRRSYHGAPTTIRPAETERHPPPRKRVLPSAARPLPRPPMKRRSQPAGVSRAPPPKFNPHSKPAQSMAARSLRQDAHLAQQASAGRKLTAVTATRTLPLPPCIFGPKLVFVGSFSGDQASGAGCSAGLVYWPRCFHPCRVHALRYVFPPDRPFSICSAPRWAGWCWSSTRRCPPTCGRRSERCGDCRWCRGHGRVGSNPVVWFLWISISICLPHHGFVAKSFLIRQHIDSFTNLTTHASFGYTLVKDPLGHICLVKLVKDPLGHI